MLADEADTPSAPTASKDRVDPQTPNPFASSISRDALLAYTYHLYHSQNRQVPGMTPIPLNCTPPIIANVEQVCRLHILPLLVILRSLHPQDTAILLLMACTYHASGDFDSSLTLSREILRLEPNSAEAMCNIGTTMMSIGQHDQAYEWWWKALQVRPIYWDAVDHLLNFLLPLAQQTDNIQHRSILYARALDVCSFVERKAVAGNGRLLLPVPTHQLHRLQKVFFTGATIRMMNPDNISDTSRDYVRALELVIYPPTPNSDNVAYTMRELILAIFVAGYLIQSTSVDPVSVEILEILGLPGDSAPIDALALAQSGFDVFRAVRVSGDRLVSALLNLAGNALPFLLLLPEHVPRVPMMLFPGSMGVLPGICIRAPNSSTLLMPPDDVRKQANLMTSSVLLALAKRYQDLSSADVAITGLTGTLNVNYSLSILFYYLALALSPSPPTYNNMGIVLSTMAYTSSHTTDHGERREFSGPALARVYYTAGLQMDPSHPHLLTNLGSLHKDEGNLEEAMKLYSKAISIKPDFDVALVNMGNAVKDTGRSWDALEYYRRAVESNPGLPEAVCGLVNSMASICDWRGRGSYLDEFGVDVQGYVLPPSSPNHAHNQGYIKKMIDICEDQLQVAYSQNTHAVSATKTLDEWLESLQLVFGRPLRKQEFDHWARLFGQFYGPMNQTERQINEGGFIIRFIDWIQPRLQRRWYIKVYGKAFSAHQDTRTDPQSYGNVFLRPALPRGMTPPTVPSVLPFHTFIYPLPARMIRLISHRNALRTSFTALSQPWLPKHVYPPPGPPVNGVLNIGYVSNDVNDHPLSHLMQSVFGMHDRKRFRVYLYTTSTWDGTSYRPKISGDVEVFVDASQWSTAAIVEHISQNKIHILINLGGYTKGARNDVFAARPCPIQMQLMGYAGTLGAGWCDYLVCDPVSCPQDMCATEVWRRRRSLGNGSISDAGAFLDLNADPDPERQTDDFAFSENFLYMPHTFMVTDHKQSFRTDENLSPEEREHTPVETLWRNEEARRVEMRQAVFPNLSQDVVIFANFNQLYKIDPGIFAIWLRILKRVPNSILWLLRFPAAGEEQLHRTVAMWAGEDMVSRVRFTDVAKKDIHVHRGRVADLFLDTVECNAHTIAADVLWPGTPILTFPKHRHKMSSRVAASMAYGTGFGREMVVNNLEEYEDRAVALANSVKYSPTDGTLRGEGELIKLRKNLFLNRDRMPLFDTARWTRNMEKGYIEAWRRWVEGTQFELSDEWEACTGPEKESGCIFVPDEDPVEIIRYE